MVELIEEAVEGCWVGYRARIANAGNDGIGTFYSPPSATSTGLAVETVIDIGSRPEVRFRALLLLQESWINTKQGWSLLVERGGIRRVLMNLMGNSLKFTTVSGLLLTPVI
jgi:hypothetical protein